MHDSVKKLSYIKNKINDIINKKQLNTHPEIIAVSKKFPINKILPLIDAGHMHFGENQIQEAEQKWLDVKKKYKNLQLHMVGKLQSNKAKKAVQLFDYLHSLDNSKLALKISQYSKEIDKKIKIFIQVNIGEEQQKSGILIKDLDNFYYYCVNELSLDIIGLMCLPPIDSDSSHYFEILKKKSDQLKLKTLSMGMSADYENALLYGTSFLRLGTAIFGNRT